MKRRYLHVVDIMIIVFILMIASIGICNGENSMSADGTEMVGPGPKVKKNKATYGRSQGTYRPKSFYSGRKAPKKKSAKNMPSATRHIG